MLRRIDCRLTIPSFLILDENSDPVSVPATWHHRDGAEPLCAGEVEGAGDDEEDESGAVCG